MFEKLVLSVKMIFVYATIYLDLVLTVNVHTIFTWSIAKCISLPGTVWENMACYNEKQQLVDIYY